MIFTITALNAKQVATRFERMGIASVSAKPAMETVAGMMMRILSAVFDSQGRRGGGSWRFDTIEWLTRKQRTGLDPRINHATLTLRRSLTERGAEHQVLAITDSAVHLSSDLPYAATTQRHRPVAKFTLRDKAAMRTVVRDHLMAAWRAPVA